MSDVERWWFRRHADGQELPELFDGDAELTKVAEADAEADLATYAEEITAARAAAAGHDLDQVVASRDDHPERTRDVRWLYIHMIEECARHNGHAALLREVIDGTTGV